MTSTAVRVPAVPLSTVRPVARVGRPTAAHITPNVFAMVMGTGIVGTAAAGLPLQVPGLRTVATVIWLLAAALLVVLLAAFVTHWVRYAENARAYLADRVAVQFTGALPMALLTVGSGTLILGAPVLGTGLAVGVDAVLWVTGTLLGLATSVLVPFAMITRRLRGEGEVTALPAWLMPVVPPMVSATGGALLLPHVPAGELRLTLLLACYGLVGLSLLVGMMTLTLVWSRLLHGGVLPTQAAPTVWISLGMIGQSVTAVNLLGAGAAGVVPAATAAGLHVFGVVFGLLMGGFGALVFVLAVLLTGHAARTGLSFSLTWWSFTFPIGTCVTGATALGAATGSVVIRGLAVVLFVVLAGVWATVATGTVRGVLAGRLFRG
ncbi:TDT family transporter [Nakamurella flavida]|uniref:TDT family transporter n=1 Tax=Nakamurella flavida TaxID=363630 RepID=A0A939C540_9ACTN|nr:TDT family transporter [Nakamurella flavida]MBM9476414.1 TDT family transporter [Nakamurella flavida]MDP9779485.1 C4-dicarboxylate transporter/malic acid transport protein [Nakamurella flavida]